MPKEITFQDAKKLPLAGKIAYDVAVLIAGFLQRSGRLQEEWNDIPLDGLSMSVLTKAVEAHLSGVKAPDKQTVATETLDANGPGVEAVIAAVAGSDKAKRASEIAQEIGCSEERVAALVKLEGSGLTIGRGGYVKLSV